jgi:tetratricopeptide (TPR) repeat protein
MACVFLSYDREDAATAGSVARALEKAGHSVWWDLHIKGGAEYGREIETALEQSDAVVVLWSTQSVASPWVRDEAAAGRDGGRLIPVLIEQVTPPMGFRQYQNLDFMGWKGRGKPPRLAELLASIDAISAPQGDATASTASRPPTTPAAAAASVRKPLPQWLLMGGAVMLALLILGPLLGFVMKGVSKDEVHTISVRTVDTASVPLARDLLVNLNRLQSAKSGSVRLLSDEDIKEGESDLIFETGLANDPGKIGASLILMNGRDRSILWSKDFDQPSGKLADLKQQIAFSAARVLDCALEGLDAEASDLKPQTFKLYLNACAQVSDSASSDPRPLIATFRQVVEDSPRFEPAWANLVLVESDVVWMSEVGGDVSPKLMAQLRADIESAEKLNDKMPEPILAQIALLPTGSYAESLELVERADRASPSNPLVLSQRADLLRRVGRQRESVESAKRAAELDPLSPFTRNAYISALAYAGRLNAAREELAKAEQLWPGTATLNDIKLRFHLRYGDPNEALKLFRAQGEEGSPNETFLKARLDPTPANINKLVKRMRERLPVVGVAGLGFAVQAYGEFDRNDELARILLAWPKATELGLVADLFFRPTADGLRKDPRFIAIAKRAGLVDYWRKSGKWPDFCGDPELPYNCKTEVAKLGA